MALQFCEAEKIELTTGHRTIWTSETGRYRVSYFETAGYSNYYRAEWRDMQAYEYGQHKNHVLWDLCEMVRFKTKARAVAACEKHLKNSN